MSLIDIREVRKTYRIATGGFWRRKTNAVEALRGLDLQVDPGELIGLIGPNGAGKSTLVKVLAGILVPDSGQVTVAGRIPWRERSAHVAGIGVVFGQRTQLWWDLPTRESFGLLKTIYKVSDLTFKTRMETLVDRLDLGSLLAVPVRQLSLGQRMRCEIAAALLHSPSLLFLDEPTIGLDAASKLAVRDFVRDLNRTDGTTIVLTTHDMSDIEALCQRVVVVARGVVLSDGSLQQLRHRFGREREMVVECEQDIEDPEAVWVRRDGNATTLRFDPTVVSAANLMARLSDRFPIRDVTVTAPPIEEAVANAYRETGS